MCWIFLSVDLLRYSLIKDGIMLSYQETLNEIYSLKAVKQTNKHESMLRICERLGNPHKAYKVIHITGTSGKGTVSLQTAWTLYENGHKVGLIISPHLLDFRERITVNFQKIPEGYITQKYQEIITLFKEEGLEYSFEQVVCILGFVYLRDLEVEYGVIEVGCGGARDSSNIVDPVVSVITSVGLDHMHLLGNTIEEIAIEKAGVIKPSRPCVVGLNAPQDLLRKIARERNSEAFFIERETSGERVNFIEENSKVTRKIFEVVRVSTQALEKGLMRRQPFRFQRVEAFGKKFVVDVGHNAMSIERVIRDCIFEFGEDIRVVLCASKGKNPSEFISLVFSLTTCVHFTSCDHMRMVPVSDLIQSSSELGLTPQHSAPISELLPHLKTLVDSATLIIGSCFLIESLVNCFKSEGIELE